MEEEVWEFLFFFRPCALHVPMYFVLVGHLDNYLYKIRFRPKRKTPHIVKVIYQIVRLYKQLSKIQSTKAEVTICTRRNYQKKKKNIQ